MSSEKPNMATESVRESDMPSKVTCQSTTETASEQGTRAIEQESQGDADAQEKRRSGSGRGKKRKRPRDINAPKQPLTGYVRFINDRREKVRSENPTLSFIEINKLLGSEWSNLAANEKQYYLDLAEKDKERYNKELNSYQSTEAFKMFMKKQRENKSKEDGSGDGTMNGAGGDDDPLGRDDDDIPTFDIPIFTEEFLDHNKARESELRSLRKQNTELEEQNAVLSKHVDSMKQAVDRLDVEVQQQRANNSALQEHLTFLRAALVKGFSNVNLPAMNEKPSLETIDSYMSKLHQLMTSHTSPQEREVLVATVRDVVSRLRFDV